MNGRRSIMQYRLLNIEPEGVEQNAGAPAEGAGGVGGTGAAPPAPQYATLAQLQEFEINMKGMLEGFRAAMPVPGAAPAVAPARQQISREQLAQLISEGKGADELLALMDGAVASVAAKVQR